jgi:HD-GYP domain-containing protein (c-di-GMP phosphodiesterase class II)
VHTAAGVGLLLGLGGQALRDLRYGAAFHDIGKIAVPEAILNKPGPLTDAERAEVERHVVVGEQILAPIEFLAGVRPLVRHGHEHWDGGGYPDRLAGEQIPLGSRIILACDAIDAMTSDRPYRAAMPEAEARRELRRFAGSPSDPQIVDALLEVLDRQRAPTVESQR